MEWLKGKIEEIEREGLFRSLNSVGSPQGTEIEISGHRLINFCSNNYLGLAADPRLKEAAREAVDRFGAGSGAARLVSGNFSLHEELESGLARLKETEAALLFNSGYHANIGVIPALAGEGDLIFSDALNHASLIDGCRLSKAAKVVYRHNDMNHLEDLLRQARRSPLAVSARGGSASGGGWESPPGDQPTASREPQAASLLIVTEAVFSMEGDLCPLKDLLGLAEKYGATVYLDEAHAVGVFGKNGEGLAPRNPPENLICMGTLGKAFGSYGAFIAGSRSLRDFLINRARSFIFTTALPPAAIGASLAALKIVQEEPERRRLWENIGELAGRVARGELFGLLCLQTNKKFPEVTGPDLTPIFSIRIGDTRKTMEISQKLFEQGIYVQGIRPPSVPEGTSRLRLTVMATHTREHLQRLSECLKIL